VETISSLSPNVSSLNLTKNQSELTDNNKSKIIETKSDESSSE
jgi:hypothetical protein